MELVFNGIKIVEDARRMHCVTLTFELPSLVLGLTHRLNVIHIYSKLFQNPCINVNVMEQTLKHNIDLGPSLMVLVRVHCALWQCTCIPSFHVIPP